MPDKTDPPDDDDHDHMPGAFRDELRALGDIARALESLSPPRRARAVLLAALSVAPRVVPDATLAALIEAARQPEATDPEATEPDDWTPYSDGNPGCERRVFAGRLLHVIARRDRDGCGWIWFCHEGGVDVGFGVCATSVQAKHDAETWANKHRVTSLDEVRARMQRIALGDEPANIQPTRPPIVSAGIADFLALPDEVTCTYCGCKDFLASTVTSSSSPRVDVIVTCKQCGREYDRRK